MNIRHQIHGKYRLTSSCTGVPNFDPATATQNFGECKLVVESTGLHQHRGLKFKPPKRGLAGSSMPQIRSKSHALPWIPLSKAILYLDTTCIYSSTSKKTSRLTIQITVRPLVFLTSPKLCRLCSFLGHWIQATGTNNSGLYAGRSAVNTVIN